MRAAVFESTGDRLAVRETPLPSLRDGELLLKVAYVGICGSDLHAASTAGMLSAGTVMGHEFTGEVVESQAADWQIGERVAVNPAWVCDVCARGGKCHDGRDPACAQSVFMGFKPEVPGAYAEFVRIRASQAIRLPDALSLRDGALMEPLAVARHAVERCGPIAGESVLIMGGGPIGLGVLLMAQEAGAGRVVVSEPDATRRACALQLGAAAVVDPSAENLAAALARLGVGEPDVVFECIGGPGFLQQAIDVMAPRARVAIVGVCMTEDRMMPLAAIRKEATLRFMLGYTAEDFAFACSYLSHHASRAAAMISDVVSLDALPDIFEKLKRDKSLIKVLVAPCSAPSR